MKTCLFRNAVGMFVIGVVALLIGGCGNPGQQNTMVVPVNTVSTGKAAGISGDAQIIIKLVSDLKTYIAGLPADTFRKPDTQNIFLDKLDTALKLLNQDKVDQGLQQFVSVSTKLDGCLATPPAPDADDWVLSCGISNTISADIKDILCINSGGGIASISISAAQTTVLLTGSAVQFTATAALNSAAGTECPAGVDVTGSAYWNTSASAIGAVAAGTGLFTPLSPGTTDITATLGPLTSNVVSMIVIMPECMTDADCDDSNPATADTCINPGQADAVCTHTQLLKIATEVSASGSNTCALVNDGTIMCWGYNFDGQLGNGTRTIALEPVSVTGISDAVSVEISPFGHACAIVSGGSIKCWGANYWGALGNGSPAERFLIPVDVVGITDAIKVVAGYHATCALLNGGTIKCWGNNYSGQLGNGTLTHSNVPVQVTGITNAVSITAGLTGFCALLPTGGVKCWGSNSYGQLGIGTTGGYVTRPVDVLGITNAVSIEGGAHANVCAGLSTGGIKCWGSNRWGALGNGSTTDSPVPVDVAGIANASSITHGGLHGCSILTGSAGVKCWGFDSSGQLGDGSVGSNGTYYSTTPISMTVVSNVVGISAGAEHTCVVISDGGLRCFGRNLYGSLGNGTTRLSEWPVNVIGFM